MEEDLYIAPFLIHARRVWEDVLGRTLYRNAYVTANEKGITDDITVAIGVKGSLIIEVFYGFETESAKTVAGVMMEQDIEDLDETALSALGKLASTISGRAATTLSKAGYDCQISPPLIVKGEGRGVSSETTTQIHAVFNSGLGPLQMRFGLSRSIGNS